MPLEGKLNKMVLAWPTCWAEDSPEADAWLQMALERGIAPDDEAIRQIIQERNSPLAGMAVDTVRWPEEPLRSAMIRTPSRPVSFAQL